MGPAPSTNSSCAFPRCALPGTNPAPCAASYADALQPAFDALSGVMLASSAGVVFLLGFRTWALAVRWRERPRYYAYLLAFQILGMLLCAVFFLAWVDMRGYRGLLPFGMWLVCDNLENALALSIVFTLVEFLGFLSEGMLNNSKNSYRDRFHQLLKLVWLITLWLCTLVICVLELTNLLFYSYYFFVSQFIYLCLLVIMFLICVFRLYRINSVLSQHLENPAHTSISVPAGSTPRTSTKKLLAQLSVSSRKLLLQAGDTPQQRAYNRIFCHYLVLLTVLLVAIVAYAAQVGAFSGNVLEGYYIQPQPSAIPGAQVSEFIVNNLACGVLVFFFWRKQKSTRP